MSEDSVFKCNICNLKTSLQSESERDFFMKIHVTTQHLQPERNFQPDETDISDKKYGDRSIDVQNIWGKDTEIARVYNNEEIELNDARGDYWL